MTKICMTDLARHNPCLIHLLHRHSPSKISKPGETRDDGEIFNFEIVLGDIFDVNKPIAYDENKAASYQKRLSDYNNSATTPIGDDTQPNP